MFDQILLWTFGIATAVQIFFWLFFFSRLAFYKELPTDPAPQPPLPVSVIICAHNEADNLRKHLSRFLNQSYRSFELIVISHNTTDESKNVLTSLQRKYEHLRVVECNDRKQGKKFALAKGIEQATHHVLLLTDADCWPASDQWISQMVEALYDENTQIVLGVAPFAETPGWLNRFARYETYFTAVQYLSFCLAGLPYMGVGRNLAYRKKLFEQTGGFRKHEHLASGDDDLFVNQAAAKGKVGIRLNPSSFIFTESKTSWLAYFRQKQRHYSTGRRYKLHYTALLATLAVSHFLHYLGGLLVALKIGIIFALLGYSVRMFVVLTIGSVNLSKLQCRSLRFWAPALDAALVLHYLVFFPFTLMDTNTQRWN